MTDRPAASGYAYVDAAAARRCLLAATHRKAASALLWEGLASADPRRPRRRSGTSAAANQWALDVAVAARLEIHSRGFLALRHAAEPAPYLPHPTFL